MKTPWIVAALSFLTALGTAVGLWNASEPAFCGEEKMRGHDCTFGLSHAADVRALLDSDNALTRHRAKGLSPFISITKSAKEGVCK